MKAPAIICAVAVCLIGCGRSGIPGDLRKAAHLVEEGRWAEARAALEPAIDRDPDRALLRYLIGIIEFEGGGDPALATTEFERALALAPTFDLNRYFLALADHYRSTGRIGRAVETYRACIALHSSGDLAYRAQTALAQLYESAGNYQEAAKLYERIVRTFRRQRNTAGLELHLAEIYEHHLAEMRIAVATYERVAARYAGSPESSLAKSALVLMRRQHPEFFRPKLSITEHRRRQTTDGYCVRGKVHNAGDVAAGFTVVTVTLVDGLDSDVTTAKAYVKGLHVSPGATADFEVKLPDAEYVDYRLELAWEDMGY